MSDVDLTPAQWIAFDTILRQAFPTLEDFRRLTRFGLDMNLADIVPDSKLSTVTMELREWAESKGRVRDLLNAAYTATPDNPALSAFCTRIGYIPGVPNSELSTQRSELPRTNLPYRHNESFVGRADEIAAVVNALTAGRAVAVTGTGGLGKTQLAIEVGWAGMNVGTYPGGVWWVPLAEPGAVVGAVAALGGPDALALPGWQEGQPDANRKLVQQAWAGPTMRLLIFDNLDDPARLDSWRPPPTSGCRVLITSRCQGDWPDDSGVDEVPLEPLTGLAATTLLVGRRARAQHTTAAALLAAPATTTAAGAIVKWMGGLPLALAVAAAYLKQYPGVTLTAYREALAREALAHPTLAGTFSTDLPTKHATGIAATFALSYDQLQPAAPLDALALRLLHAAAAAAPEPIPRPLLYRAGAADPEEDEPLPPERADPALGRLSALGLLDELPDTRLRLHRLLAAYVQTRPLPSDDAALRLETALVAEVYAINRAGYPLAGTPYLPHLQHTATVATPRNDADAAAVLTNLGYLLQEQGDYAAAHLPYERALAIYTATLGPNHPDTAGGFNNLGQLLQAQGKYVAARPLLTRALIIYEATLEASDPQIASSLNNLAELLREQGEYAAARPLYERALMIDEAFYGPNNEHVATDLNNLALLLKLQGEWDAAYPLYKRGLMITEATLGPTHPQTATSLSNLATLLRAQGKLAEARRLFERTLAIREAQLGPNHPDTAGILNNLAGLLRQQGNYTAAYPLAERALAITEQTLGSVHPATITCRNNLAGLLQDQGNSLAARQLYERALATAEEIFGPHHPNTAATRNNLALLLKRQGEFATARTLFDQTLASAETTLGANHPDTAISLSNLAGLLVAQGDWTAAGPLYDRAVVIAERILGPDHPSTLQYRANRDDLLRKVDTVSEM